MKILISGASGFIGSALTKALLERGHTIQVISRNCSKFDNNDSPEIKCVTWPGETADDQRFTNAVENSNVIINLAGENLGRWPWTRSFKSKILQSRIYTGQTLSAAVKAAGTKPDLFIQASASGYYGDTGTSVADESTLPGTGFLADVCKEWEASSAPVEELGVRRIIMRIGVVLGPGGLINKIKPIFKLFLGGKQGSGNQGFPWIHLEDLIRAVILFVENDNLSGPFNLNAPQKTTNADFCHAMADALNRPCWLHAPAFMIRAALGEMGQETLIKSQFIEPKALQKAGFKFKFNAIKAALKET